MTNTDSTVVDGDLKEQLTGSVIRDSVQQALQNFFTTCDGESISNVYQIVLSEVEEPLLECVMSFTKNNQTIVHNGITIVGL